MCADFKQLNDLARDASAMVRKMHVLMCNTKNVVVLDFEMTGRRGSDLHNLAIPTLKIPQYGDHCPCIIPKHRCHRTMMSRFAERNRIES